MIIVDPVDNSRSQRVPWLLEELGLDYEVPRLSRFGLPNSGRSS